MKEQPTPANPPKREPSSEAPLSGNLNGEQPGTSADEAGRRTLFVESGKPYLQQCPNCGHYNRTGILICEKCGTMLLTEESGGQPAVSTKRLETEEPSTNPKPVGISETAEIVSAAVSSAGSAQFNENMILRLEIEGSPTPLLLQPKAETTIGRRDPATGTMPDVDMTAYAGYRLGVSRNHAVIRLKNRQLEIYDLGSSNGTAINGERLAAHQPHTLRDGDELMLGKMIMRVLFQVRNRRTT